MIGLCAALSPMGAHAATSGMFESIFEDASTALRHRTVSGGMEQYIIDEMLRWEDRGVRLTTDRLEAAMNDDDERLCTGLVDDSGDPITLARGADTLRGTCGGLRAAIRELINAEASMDALGRDLLSIANSAELAISDEPGRILDLAATAGALHRTWAGGTGAIASFPPSALPKITALEQALSRSTDIAASVRRFRHGFFRDRREADPAAQAIGADIAAALDDLALALGITGDEGAIGAMRAPDLAVPNVALWIRRDDLGLLWKMPTRVVPRTFARAGRYPVMKAGGETLAYPFDDSRAVLGSSRQSPLCSRPIAREGFLCRSVPEPPSACAPPAGTSSSITLVRCNATTTTSPAGPPLCEGFASDLRRDDGRTLSAPPSPALLQQFPPLDLADACDPESGAIYPDDIRAHACYAAACLAQSMSGHSLIPGRAPTLAVETTTPFLGFLRPDPALGLIAEAAHASVGPLPRYEGHELIAGMERALCAIVGEGKQTPLGRCIYDTERSSADPPRLQGTYTALIMGESTTAAVRQSNLLQALPQAGMRTARAQADMTRRRSLTVLASVVEQMASLILSLERAPITTLACPWTGPFPPNVTP